MAIDAPPVQTQLRWQQSALGGGGYITGLLQHPQQPNILYARCDVAGVFKSEDGAQSWRTVNRGMTESHHHNVQSFSISPHHPNVLFRCSGDARGQKRFGTIHKSVDNGETWYEVCSEVDYYGNGPTRMHAEVIAFDSFNANCVVTGGYSTGAWVSLDEGESWRYAGLSGERISSVYFHPLVRNTIYVGTVSDRVLAVKDQGKRWANEDMAHKLARFHDFARGNQGRLYRTTDRGQTWELLGEDYDFVDLAFDIISPETIYLATLLHGIRKSTDSGRTWQQKTIGLPEDMAYNTIAISRDNTLYTAPDARPQHTDLPPIPIYRSVDQGESWQLIANHTHDDIRNYPPYMSLRHAGWAVSTLLIDDVNSNRLYLCNWFGVARSDDAGQTWDAHGFKGIESTCAEDIVCDPTLPERVYFTLADHRPNMSDNSGRTYRAMQLEYIREHSAASDSTALAASRHRPGTVLAGLTSRGSEARPCAIMRSEDGGLSARQVAFFNDGLFVQALAESPHYPGRFYAYLEGAVANGAGLYQSNDWGTRWTNLNLALPSYLKTLPHNAAWIEAELFPVVAYQVKNACGTNQLLCVDPHQPDTLYLGEWTEGIFRVTEGGRTICRIGQGLPFGKHKTSVLVALKADAERPGVLYAGFAHDGLWRSTDYGKNWFKLFPHDDRIYNVSAIDIAGSMLVVASEPLYWSPCESSVYMSHDHGNSWRNIYDKALGAVRWKGIAIERRSGVIHGCTCGNGCFYFALGEMEM
jgi:photosystem II stability/assembly factor-like uncharacterized protein